MFLSTIYVIIKYIAKGFENYGKDVSAVAVSFALVDSDQTGYITNMKRTSF